MSLTLNSDRLALTLRADFAASRRTLNSAIERLASGVQATTTDHAPTDEGIVNRLTRQINGLDQASSNINDGISLLQVAESALTSLNDNVQRIRTLTVKAANGTYSAADRASIRAEMDELIAQSDHILDSASFNGRRLFDAANANVQIQCGPGDGNHIRIGLHRLDIGALSSVGDSLEPAPEPGYRLPLEDIESAFVGPARPVVSQRVQRLNGTSLNAADYQLRQDADGAYFVQGPGATIYRAMNVSINSNAVGGPKADFMVDFEAGAALPDDRDTVSYNGALESVVAHVPYSGGANHIESREVRDSSAGVLEAKKYKLKQDETGAYFAEGPDDQIFAVSDVDIDESDPDKPKADFTVDRAAGVVTPAVNSGVSSRGKLEDVKINVDGKGKDDKVESRSVVDSEGGSLEEGDYKLKQDETGAYFAEGPDDQVFAVSDVDIDDSDPDKPKADFTVDRAAGVVTPAVNNSVNVTGTITDLLPPGQDITVSSGDIFDSEGQRLDPQDFQLARDRDGRYFAEQTNTGVVYATVGVTIDNSDPASPLAHFTVDTARGEAMPSGYTTPRYQGELDDVVAARTGIAKTRTASVTDMAGQALDAAAFALKQDADGEYLALRDDGEVFKAVDVAIDRSDPADPSARFRIDLAGGALHLGDEAIVPPPNDLDPPFATLETIDALIGEIDASRGAFGSTENALLSAIDINWDTSLNLKRARSRIAEIDYAQETARLSRARILQSASGSLIAQANQNEAAVIKLLI